MPLVGEKRDFFLRPNKNKTQPRLRPAHRDVLDGFRYVPAKTVSKIYRKHLAESIGKSRGHQEVQGRYTFGLCNWLSRPGVQEMAVGFQALGGQTHSGGGPCRSFWCFPLGITSTCISVPICMCMIGAEGTQ